MNLIEAAYLIVNAGHIYEKKVDFFYELVRRSAERNENESEATDKKYGKILCFVHSSLIVDLFPGNRHRKPEEKLHARPSQCTIGFTNRKC